MGDPAAGGALGPELSDLVVLEVGVAELSQGRASSDSCNNAVRFWGGIAGVLRNTVGRLEFTRTAEGAWLRETIDIRLDLRIVFWNLRRRIVRQWTEYTPIPATDQ